MVRPIRIGTRKSKLAIIQAIKVRQALENAGLQCVLIPISSHGDRSLGGDLSAKVGQFVDGIDRLLISGEADITVHSAKDVPVDSKSGIRALAYLARGATSDFVLSKEMNGWKKLTKVLQNKSSKRLMDVLEDLPMKSKVGTVSGRRQSFLLSSRPDIIPISVRGHIETRLDGLLDGRVSFLILAEIGLKRLHESNEISKRHLGLDAIRIREEDWPTAPGQGAIAVHCRDEDSSLTEKIRTILNHEPTFNEVERERGVLKRLGGGCLYPAGVLSMGSLITTAVSPSDWRSKYARGETFEIARYKGDFESFIFEDKSLDKMSEKIERNKPTLITTLTSDRISTQLRKKGIPTIDKPVVKLSPLAEAWPRDFLSVESRKSSWPILVLTSPFAAKCAALVSESNPEVAKIPWLTLGEGTHKACFQAGITAAYCGMAINSENLVTYIRDSLPPGSTLFVPRSSSSDQSFCTSLAKMGFLVRQWIGYENTQTEVEGFSMAENDVLLVSSPSSAESWAKNQLPSPSTILSMGKSTTTALETTPYFQDSAILTLDGPTVEYILAFWESRSEEG